MIVRLELLPLLSKHSPLEAAHADIISFTPEAKMAHLKSFITEIVGEPCIVVGASLGGAIAILLATESPELVEKVVLIDAQVYCI